MANQSILINIGGSWKELDLYPGSNALSDGIANSIEDITVRRISTTTTFSLPPTSRNITYLQLNIFNHKDLAGQINKRYDCRITVDEEVSVEGFLVINNMLKDINVNIIDPALDILELWKTKSMRDMIMDDSVVATMPAAYQTVINELKTYLINASGLPALTNISGQDYPLALFPNTLNSIGDKFNINADGIRVVDTGINARQSRPVFNVKAFLDLAAYCFEYTPNYESDVDVARLKEMYITPKVSENNLESSTDSVLSPLNIPQYAHFTNGSVLETVVRGRTGNENWVRPDNIPGYVNPPNITGTLSTTIQTVYVPRVSQSSYGDIVVNFSIDRASKIFASSLYVMGMYRGVNPGDNVVYSILVADIDLVTPAIKTHYNYTINKAQLATGPGSGELIGIVSVLRASTSNTVLTISGGTGYNETYVDYPNGIVYTEDLEYELGTRPDLRYEAMEESFRDLIMDLMINQGILLDIDAKNKIVNYYTFDRFRSASSINLSKYFISSSKIQYDTNFGNKYGVVTELSLGSPFRGNTKKVTLTNQGIKSKMPAYKLIKTAKLKDVSKILKLSNRFEYTSSDLGLVEYAGDIVLDQVNINGTEIASDFSFPHIVNFNYNVAPAGIIEWLRIVDDGLRVEGYYLLPAKIHKNISIRNMYYVDMMGGYVILEKISEYIDSSTPVKISFIRPNFT